MQLIEQRGVIGARRRHVDMMIVSRLFDRKERVGAMYTTSKVWFGSG